MYNLVTEINKKRVPVTKELLKQKITEAEGRKGRLIYKLYDLGYISSSSQTDDRELLYMLKDMYKGLLGYMTDKAKGKLCFNAEMLDYAACMYRKKTVCDEDFEILIKTLSEYLSCIKDIKALGLILNNARYTKTGIAKLGVDVKAGPAQFGTRSKYLDMDSNAVKELLLGSDTAEKSMNGINMTGLVFYLGLNYDNGKEPFFCKGLTRKEEEKYYKLIIHGSIELNGRYGSILKARMQEFIRSTEGSAMNSGTFEEQVMVDIFNSKRKYIEKMIPVYGNSIVYIDNYKIVYDTGNKTSDTVANFGSYTINYVTGTQFPKINIINGMQGEFVLEQDVVRMGWLVNSLPVSIITGSDGTEENAYPVGNVFTANSVPLEPLVGNKMNFAYVDPMAVFHRLWADSREGAYSRILGMTGNPEDSYNRYVAELVLIMICMDCGETEYKYMGITDFSRVDERTKLKACFDAETIFNSLAGQGVI